MPDKQHFKLVLTGSVGAGKTTAIASISDIPPVTTESRPTDGVAAGKASTTVAMDYGHCSLGDGLKVHLYGTPGQRRFDFMSSVLTCGASGLIILVNNTHPTPLAELDYYLGLNADFLSGRPAVVGVTHLDLVNAPALDDYRACLAGHWARPPVFGVDTRNRADILALVDALIPARQTLKTRPAASRTGEIAHPLIGQAMPRRFAGPSPVLLIG